MDNGQSPENRDTDNTGGMSIPDVFGLPSDTPGMTEYNWTQHYREERDTVEGDPLPDYEGSAPVTFRSIPLDNVLEAQLNHILDNA